jgi:DNA-binding Lrp family transcriptional regulator
MQLSWLQQQLINDYQREFPLCSAPFKLLAKQYNVDEETILSAMNELQTLGVLSRLGAVFDHKKAGASTLAALKVPEQQLDTVANIINQFVQVNHNYAREHEYNLWFVVTDTDMVALNNTLTEIENKTGLPLLILPMEASYHIDLSFNVDFSTADTETKNQAHKDTVK